MKYLLDQATVKKTPQGEPIPGREAELWQNNAGGYVFKADSWTRLERFLILGTEGGTYYVDEHDLTKENVSNVRACIAHDGLKAVSTIWGISMSGRAPKNDPALYALALAASYADVKVREAAFIALPHVARIGTHLFTFCAFIDSMRGWGPALRRAVAAWYTEKPVDALAYQVLKYQQRNGWSHRDVFRLAHPNPSGQPMDGTVENHLNLFGWIMGKQDESYPTSLVGAFERAKANPDPNHVARLIRSYGLTREMIPTETQRSPEVWEALLERMPATAMIRTLGRMGSVGLLVPFSQAARTICDRLADSEQLRASRVHPIQFLNALLTYRTGKGLRGNLEWPVVPQVVDALNEAFYAAFDQVIPAGKRFYLGIDVSGSMTHGEVAGIPNLTPNMGAAAMAMLIARTEPNHFIGGFATQFIDLGITRSDTLEAAMKKARRNFGGTDCSTAIAHALDSRYPVDVFVVITDGETWAGDKHTCQALVEYRQKSGIAAKLIVINMVANMTSLCDVEDHGSLDVVGFDASVPALINEFVCHGGNESA